MDQLRLAGDGWSFGRGWHPSGNDGLRHVGFVRTRAFGEPGDGGASLVQHLGLSLAWWDAGNLLQRPGHPAERPSKVGKIDQGKQQASNPEDVHVSEQRQQAQYGDDFELQLMGFVSYALRQRVQ